MSSTFTLPKLSFFLNAQLMLTRDLPHALNAYTGRYDLLLVGTSLIIAMIAAYVALSISDRIVAARTAEGRWAWTSAGAISMGAGIWSMHFIGMLAFSLPCGVSYSPGGTLLSMIPGILASGVALNAVSVAGGQSFQRVIVSSVLIGLGIGAMHYAGMAATQHDALLLYNVPLLAISIVVAVALAFVSLWIHSRRRTDDGLLRTLMAATAMGASMATMHYTAMQASMFFPEPIAHPATNSLSPHLLALMIATIAVLMAAITLVATFAGRQSDLAKALSAEVIDRQRIGRDLVAAREQAEAANLAKSQFLASMSHEIRTPLNGVIGNLELLGLTSPSRDQRELIEQGEKAATSLLALIGNILDFSKIEEGKLTIEMGNSNPWEIVMEAIALLQSRAQKKGIFIGASFDQDIPDVVQSDTVRLRQIVLNLAGNALKFTQEGGVLIKLSTADWDGDLCTLRFTVHDSGRGFDPARSEVLFSPFVQDQVAIDTSEGTGLGLSISRSLVEAMGGKIGCESVPGEGATFWFELPVQVVKAAPAARPVQLAGHKVAILGSNVSGAAFFVRYFKMRGATIIHATDIETAVAALKSASGEPAVASAVLISAGSDVSPVMVRGLRADRIVPLLYGMDGSADHYRRALRTGFMAAFSREEGPSLLDRNIATYLDRDSAPDEKTESSGEITELDESARNKRILVLEDRVVNQLVIQKQLIKLQLPHVLADNGVAGLAALEKETFDLVLCDCSMPEMNGYEFTRTVRGREKANDAGTRLPIIALTANAFREDVEKCHQAGMDDFISKPVSLERLRAVLTKWLSSPSPQTEGIALSSASPAVDLGILEEILGPTEDRLIRDILGEFVQTSYKSLATLEAALASGRVNGVQVAAHGAKGEARSVGAHYLGKLYADVERHAKAGDITTAADKATKLPAEIYRVRNFITHHIQPARCSA